MVATHDPSHDTGSPTPLAPGARDSEAQREETRQAILAAAREVFFDDGFAAANLNRIAERAGVGKGTVYRNFENKAELFVTVLVEHGAKLQCELKRNLRPEKPVLEQIRNLAEHYLEMWTRDPTLFQLFWAVQSQDVIGSISPALLAQVGRVSQGPLDLLEELIERGIAAGEVRPCNPGSTANAVTALANACIIPIIDPRIAEIARPGARAAFDAGVDLVVNGLRAHD
ncbi:MAG: TetR/AcrR family transcriptional regulator [Myxococcota bacterium]